MPALRGRARGRAALSRVLLSVAMVCGACAGAENGFHLGAGSAVIGPGFPYRSEPGFGPGFGWALPGDALDPWQRPRLACDALGRCWSLGATEHRSHRHGLRSGRPPDWAAALPERGHVRHRFVRPRSNLVCDRASRICYKRGNVDKSTTEDVFGERAGDRADDLRDRFGTGRLFVPQRDVACDRDRRACFEDGVADRSLTRRYFGRNPAKGGPRSRRSRAK